ncbi:MAG: riboflavin biosynthesis protein RibF [Trueperaceae bacterium]|nr:riboflavin biosynthesis protein RibF [Trueperaceae bacterium]
MTAPSEALHRIEETRTRGGVVAIGNFDGVHAGHRALLAHAADLARREHVPWTVVSFFPPAKVLFGGAQFLSSRSEKHELLRDLGPEEVVIVPFDHDFAATPAERFVEALTALSPTAIVVGEDFRFGRDRKGATEDLGRAAPRVEVLRLVAIRGEIVKSSTIRTALEAGDLERANRLLGAPYLVAGTVVEGDRRGRTIGVPTANLETEAKKALPSGVYAVTVDVPAAGRYWAMANVGPRPTFEGPGPSLEAHLFDFDGDLYGARLSVRLHVRLRDARRFEGIDDLRAQLARDAEAARIALARSDDPPAVRPG